MPRTAVPEITQLSGALDGLAANPTLPDDVAVRLLPYGRGFEIALRPGVAPSRELCEAFIAAGGAEDLAAARHLPDSVAARLARDPDPDVRSALAHHDRPEHGRHALFAADPDAEVRECLARNPLVSGELLAVLACDEEPAVRRAAALAWADPPEDALRALLTDPEPSVRAAASTRRPPADLRAALLADPATRLHAVAVLDLDPETVSRLAADPDEEMRRRVARHPGLGARLRDVLARDADPAVRGAVFARADTPPELRAEIHAGLLAGYLRAGEDLFGDYEGAEEDFACYAALAASEMDAYPWVEADPLPHADSPYLGMRRAAARSEALPAGARARMLDDADAFVRFGALSRTPDADLAVAEAVERRHDAVKISGRPADLVRFPAATLRRFGTDPLPRLRPLALRDPELPAPLAERLAADEDAGVRRQVAGSGHPRLPLAALLRLLGDADGHVAEAAASSPMLPQAVMRAVLDLADAAGGPPPPHRCSCAA